MTYRTTSRRVRPQRFTSGVVLPEFTLYAALQDLPTMLGSGRYGYDAAEEPIVVTEIMGMSNEMLESTFAALSSRPPSVSMYLQADRRQFPSIVVQPESMDVAARMLGDDAGVEDEDIDVFEGALVLTPDGGAVGGETTFRLPSSPIVNGATVLTITRAGATITLYRGAYTDYSITEDGVITLDDGLTAGDVLTCTRYATYGLSGGERFATIFEFSHVIFIEALNPLVTGVLTALVWRELVQKYESLQTAGLTDLAITRRSLSIWDDRVPPLGFRSELVVSGYVEWSTYKRIDFPRTISVDIDSTSGEDYPLLLTADLASLSVSPFDDSAEE